MGIAEILNWIMGGGLIAAVTALLTLGPTIRKARFEAEKAHAEAEANRLDNAEHATQILMTNIVEPLKKELNATRREMARLRKAIDGASACEHRANCPVLDSMRDEPKGDDADPDSRGDNDRRQPQGDSDAHSV